MRARCQAYCAAYRRPVKAQAGPQHCRRAKTKGLTTGAMRSLAPRRRTFSSIPLQRPLSVPAVPAVEGAPAGAAPPSPRPYKTPHLAHTVRIPANFTGAPQERNYTQSGRRVAPDNQQVLQGGQIGITQAGKGAQPAPRLVILPGPLRSSSLSLGQVEGIWCDFGASALGAPGWHSVTPAAQGRPGKSGQLLGWGHTAQF